MDAYSANNDSGILLNPSSAPTEHRKGTAPRSHSWAPEIAALLCSMVALIALVILLAKEDQKRLDDWKAPFSLNTVAAILSVLFRTPLAFVVGSCLGQGKWSWFSKRSGPVAVFAAIDEASRGPLGSLQLLWRLKARSCSDVSSHLKKQRQPNAVIDCGSNYAVESGNITNYTIPYGSNDVSYWGLDGKGSGSRSTFCGNSTVIGKTLVNPKGTYNLQNWDTLIAAFILLHPSEGYFRGEISWEDDAMTATECGLRLCIKVFQPNVTNGETEETLLSDIFERVPGSYQPIMGPEFDSGTVDNDTLKRWINDDFGNSLDSRYVEFTCTILGRTNLQLRIPSDVVAPNDVQREFNITQASITTIIDEIVKDGPQRIFDALNESFSLPTSFENAARLMSYQIRELNGSTVSGVTQKWTIYIHIRWQFMIFPIVTAVLGSVFSITVMLGSGKGKTRIMKANMLESMLHGLDEETSTQLRNSNVKEKMEKHVFVRLKDGPEGLRLRPPGGDQFQSSEPLQVLQRGSLNVSSDQSWHVPD
ncbi:uncharacterized protein PG998_004410 [Apiospora kogelbergensis]|uniref:uncharacterized protein n=1 Tax=Apiospora kogelbergensis TaxID=1337665 RepID=UPI003131A90C